MKKLIELRKQKKTFGFLLIFIWILNIGLIILPVYHFIFNGNKLVIDKYFTALLILNVLSFYLTFKIADKLHFLKYQYNHFKNLNYEKKIFK